jgi:hypothetical protein
MTMPDVPYNRRAEAGAKAARMLGVDVSWLPHIVQVLYRDYPNELDTAIGTAVTEHLEDRNNDPERHPYTGDGTSSCVFCNYPMNAHLEGTGL